MKLSNIFVYVLTTLWLFLGGYYIYHTWPAVMELQPNEIGDSLAGFFAPLAFFWLVAGYIQQGKELQQNTEALRLQHEELKNSVEQQKSIAATAKEEAQLLRDEFSAQRRKELITAQPVFSFFASGIYKYHEGRYGVNVTIVNTGHTITAVVLDTQPNFSIHDPDYHSVRQLISNQMKLEFEVVSDSDFHYFEVYLTYNDGLRNRQKTIFQFIKSDNDEWVATNFDEIVQS